MLIHIRVPNLNDGCWGSDTTDEQVPIIARNYADLARVYAANRFPTAELDIETTTDPGYGSQNYTVEDDTVYSADDPNSPAWEITEYMSRQWTEEPLWEAAFDADAYLVSHPR